MRSHSSSTIDAACQAERRPKRHTYIAHTYTAERPTTVVLLSSISQLGHPRPIRASTRRNRPGTDRPCSLLLSYISYITYKIKQTCSRAYYAKLCRVALNTPMKAYMSFGREAIIGQQDTHHHDRVKTANQRVNYYRKHTRLTPPVCPSLRALVRGTQHDDKVLVHRGT